MTADRKSVKLIKNFDPDHNGECLGCDSPFEKGCECIFLVSDEDPEAGEFALGGTTKPGVLKKVYVQEVYEGCANIGSGMATSVKNLWRVIAKSNQIGWIRTRPEEMGDALEPLSKEDIEKILSQDGKCTIEMDWYDAGDNGYRVPKMVNGKFILHFL